jgi:two-component system response regulator YesN
MIRVVIVDDEPNIVELIKKFCNSPAIEVVGEAGNGVEAIDVLRSTHPDMLITDIRMPGIDGLEMIKKIKQEFPDIDIVVISGFRIFDYVHSALKLGVQDFLLKPIDEHELKKMFDIVMKKRKNNEQRARYVENIENDLKTSLMHLRKEWLLKVVKQQMFDKSLMTQELFETSDNSLFCIAILKTDYCAEMNEHIPYIVPFLEKIGENIMFIIQNNNMEVIYACDETRIYFLISAAGMSMPAFQQKIENSINPLSNHLNNECYKYNVLKFHLGIGEYIEIIDNIMHSYNTALLVINSRMDTSLHTVTCYNKTAQARRYTNKYNFTPQDRNSLITLIEALDGPAIIDFFNQLLEKYIQETDSYAWIYDFANTIVQLLRYVIINKGMMDLDFYSSEYDIEYFIDNSYSIDILKERMAVYISYLVKQVTMFKENHLSRPIRVAQEYIMKNYSKQITVRDVAKNVCLSPNYFSTLFKSQTGITFLDYLTRVRMENAKNMLRDSALNISEIAYTVGYMDEKYFSRLFAKTIGIKPTEYRKFHS